MAAWDRQLVEARVQRVEEHVRDDAAATEIMQAEVRAARLVLCRVEEKVDMLVEEVTGRKQPRTPCP
jgi:hypothetical protein